jgi:hypothetical protein
MTTITGSGADTIGGQRILVVDDAPETRMILNLRGARILSFPIFAPFT